MNEFNGKQYYGYSVRNDPDLVTTTRNFEFRYMRPEFLEKAIQKVHNQQENKQQAKKTINQHMGHKQQPEMLKGDSSLEYRGNTGTQFIRQLSTEEIDNLIRKVKARTPTSSRRYNIPETIYSPRAQNPSLLCSHTAATHTAEYRPEGSFVNAATSPLLSPRGPIKGILRKVSDEKPYESGNHHHQSYEINLRKNLVSTATSPLVSPRKGNDILQIPPSSQYNGNSSPATERQHSPVKDFISTATSPLISPRKENLHSLSNVATKQDTIRRTEDLNQTYNVTTQPLIYKVDYETPNTPPAQVPQIIDNVKLEEYQIPKAKWVELIDTCKGALVETEVENNYNRNISFQHPPSPRVRRNQEYQLDGRSHNTLQLMSEIINDNELQADCYKNLKPLYEGHEACVETVILEDSDMEFEIMDRPHYTKYITSKPTPEEMFNMSVDDDGGLAEFIQIEKEINDMDVGYIRNTASLRFTEITEDSQGDINQMKIYINNKEQPRSELCVNPTEIFSTTESFSIPMRGSSPSQSIKQSKGKAKTLREQHLQRTFERLAAGGSGTMTCSRRQRSPTPDEVQSTRSSKARTNCTAPSQPQTEVGSCTNRGPAKKEKTKRANRQVLPGNLKVSKSIENLKSEKAHIFQKMTDIQEKIIEVLNKLRISLLDINVPENKLEKSKRRKNALEFAVRFSRNFLYPLRGLLDELKSTPIEQFNSLASNEASNRVCYTYNLLLQSLSTYQKQLRYFHLDHVPQKLPILIEIINATTNICLEKTIFSCQDERIAYLQQSCDKFLDFLHELQDGHLNTARENYRKLTLEKASPKYDLKMIMNPLNMYEPTLVPKVGTNVKKTKPKRHIASVAIEETKDEIKEMPKDDCISTHVQNVPTDTKSSDCLPNESIPLKAGSGDAGVLPLDTALLQAMQTLTAEQVQIVLSALSHDCREQLLTNITKVCQV